MEILKAIFWMGMGAGITMLIISLMECEEQKNCGFHPAKGYGNNKDADMDSEKGPYLSTKQSNIPRNTETFSRR